MQNILVIGGDGYIGSALVDYLRATNKYKVASLDIGWFTYNDSPNTFYFDYDTLTPYFVGWFDVVILLAGRSSVGLCGGFASTMEDNVSKFIRIINKLKPKQKFIYASSASVYGSSAFACKLKESDKLLAPVNFYDASKQAIDVIAQVSNTCYYGLRFGTVNGPSPNTRFDVMLNKMYKDAILNKMLQVSSDTAYRSILGISDLIRAIEAIIEDQDMKRGIYNLASFYDTIGNFGVKTSGLFGVKYVKDKNPTSAYSFILDTSKFEESFNFKFKDTQESILDALTSVSLLEANNGFHTRTCIPTRAKCTYV